MSMTKRNALRLHNRIVQSGHHWVTNIRRWGRGDYELAVTDLRTGIPFVVRNENEWNDRQEEAK